MKIYTAAVVAWCAALTGQATAEPEWFWSPPKAATPSPAPTTPPPTKVIQLDTNIVPTWDQLGTTKNTKKIRLWRVYIYWWATEARDKKAIKSLYSTTAEDNAAAKKVTDFYNGAEACLAIQKELQLKTRSEVDMALAEVQACIDKITKPTFTVLASQNLPNDYYLPLSVDYGTESTEEEDTSTPVVTPAPVIAQAPSPVVVPSYAVAEPVVVAAPTFTETAAPVQPAAYTAVNAVGTETTAPALSTTYTAPSALDTAAGGQAYGAWSTGTQSAETTGTAADAEADAGEIVVGSSTDSPPNQHHVGGAETTSTGFEPVSSSAEPFTISTTTTTSGNEPLSTGAEPLSSGTEPIAPGSESYVSITEPVSTGTEPQTTGTEYNNQETVTGTETTTSNIDSNAETTGAYGSIQSTETAGASPIEPGTGVESNGATEGTTESTAAATEETNPTGLSYNSEETTGAPVEITPPVAPETGPAAESITLPEPTEPAAEPLSGYKYRGEVETPNPEFIGHENDKETIQPEPIVPVVIQAPPQTFNEPVQEKTADGETIQPEPIEPVVIETTKPEFVEPTDPPGSYVSTTEPPPETNGETLAPGDEPYIKQEINPPEKPEPFEHELPPVVPTDEPVILSETNAPEKPEPFEHNLPPVGPNEGPVIISEINPPELNPKEANDIVQPPIEVKYENANGETTAPQDYNPAGEVTYEVPTETPELIYETINPEVPEPPPVNVIFSDPSGTTSEPEPFHPSEIGVATTEPDETASPETILPPVPEVITEPPENVRADLVVPDPSSWPFSPVSPAVPPLWALDVDRSDSVDFSEWQKYLKKLHGLATASVVRGRDEEAVLLLQAIVDFHYGALGKCILRKLKREGTPIVDAASYPVVAKWVEDNCYVKFRYSLLAGPPPFEWVAKDQPTVTAEEIEAWFAKYVNQAIEDISNKSVVSLSPVQREMIKRIVGCTHAELDANGDAPIHRDAFYAAIRKIDDCGAQ